MKQMVHWWFITRTTSFSQWTCCVGMEEYLGYINNKPSNPKRIVLRNNGIVNRYYALEKVEKSRTYQRANDRIVGKKNFKTIEINPFSSPCGTSSPDPDHASWINGTWVVAGKRCYRSCFSGVCCARYACAQSMLIWLLKQEITTAVATGSEKECRRRAQSRLKMKCKSWSDWKKILISALKRF